MACTWDVQYEDAVDKIMRSVAGLVWTQATQLQGGWRTETGVCPIPLYRHQWTARGNSRCYNSAVHHVVLYNIYRTPCVHTLSCLSVLSCYWYRPKVHTWTRFTGTTTVGGVFCANEHFVKKSFLVWPVELLYRHIKFSWCKTVYERKKRHSVHCYRKC